tara:strand:+ start:4566 stop:5192 length:627 start_codon:yes stop_codon:yes gene_type:complete
MDMKLKKFKNWDSFFKVNLGNRYPDNFIIQMVLSEFKNLEKKKRKNINILDLGFGAGGSNLFFLNKEKFKVFGIEKSKNAYQAIKKKIKKNNFDIEIKNGSFQSLPFDDNYFDLIIDCRSLQHLKKEFLDQSFSEIHRSLKKNGKLFSIFMNFEKNKSNFYTNLLSKKSIKKKLKKVFNKKIEIGFLDFSFTSTTSKENSFWIIKSKK